MKVKAIVLLVLLGLSALLIAVPNIRAVSPVVQTASTTCGNSAGPIETELDCTATFTNPIAVGDYEVAGFVLNNATQATCIGSTCTLTSTLNPGTAQILQNQATGSYQVGQLVVDTPAHVVGTTIVEYQFSLTNGENITIDSVEVYAWEVNGLDPAGFLCPGSGDCFATGLGSTYTMSPSSPGTDSSYLYVGMVTSQPTATLTPTAGYTTLATYNDGDHVSIGQYEVSASDALSISGGSSPDSTSYLMVGESFGLGASPPPGPGTLYGCTSNNNGASSLYTISTLNGAATLVGAMGMFGCSGLAFNSAWTLYAVGQTTHNGPEELFTVNLVTGAASNVGQINASSAGSRITDLSFQPSTGKLFGPNAASGGGHCCANLWQFNTITGAPTKVGRITPINATTTIIGGAMDFQSDGALWLGSLAPLFPDQTSQIYKVNPTTAGLTFQFFSNATAICAGMPADDGNLNAFAFNAGGVLYASLNCVGTNTHLVTMNLSTGTLSNIGTTINTLDGIAFSPDGPVIYPTTISITDGNTVTYPTKGHTFFALGLLWAFYSNATTSSHASNYVCSTSSNLGGTWSSPVPIRTLSSGFGTPGNQSAFDSYYDSATHSLALVYFAPSVVYRTAQLSSGGCGAISYNAAFTEINFGAYWAPGLADEGTTGMVTIDSGHHAWISFELIGADVTPIPSGCPTTCWMVIKDNDTVTSGTWTFAAAPQVMFKIASIYQGGASEMMPTGNGITFAAANESTGLIGIRTYSGGTWKAEVNIPNAVTMGCQAFSPPCNLPGRDAWSAMQDPIGNVHIDYLGSDDFLHYTIFYSANNSVRADFKLNGGSSFADIAYAYPTIDINGSNVYAFWVNLNTTYYQAEIAGSWGSATSLFTDGFLNTHTDNAYGPQISSRSQNFIGGLYILANHAKFFYLAPAVMANVTACVKYTLIAGGNFDAPKLHYLLVNGSARTLTLKTSLICITTRSDQVYTIDGALAGVSASTSERAVLQNATSGTFSSSTNYDFVYWHQLNVPISYTISDGVAVNHPTFTYIAMGSTNTVSNSKNPVPYWIDYNSHWTAQTPFTTSPDLTTLTGHPPSGQAASLQPIIVAYYVSSSCGNANPLTELENGCIVPGIVDAWSYGMGVAPWMGFILLGVNVAIYNKNQNVWLSLLVLWISGAVFSAVLPPYLNQIGQIFIYLGIAGLAVKAILFAR